MFLLSVPFLFAACGDDDPEPTKPTAFSLTGKSYGVDNVSDGMIDKYIITFTSNTKFQQVHYSGIDDFILVNNTYKGKVQFNYPDIVLSLDSANINNAGFTAQTVTLNCKLIHKDTLVVLGSNPTKNDTLPLIR